MNLEAPDPALLSAVVEAVSVGLVVVDGDLRVVLWNRWMADASGRPASVVLGQRLDEVFPDADLSRLRRKVRQVMVLGNQAFFDAHVHGSLFPLRRVAPLDDRFHFLQQSCTISPLPIDGCDGLVCISVSDETGAVLAEHRLRDAHRALEETSRRDALTGLFNRRTVCERLDDECRRARRNGRPVSVVLLDIDHFKRINDGWGHLAGDAVLEAVGAAIRDAVRETDMAGRYGGEEFLVVLPDTPIDGARIVTRRLQDGIRSVGISWDGQELPVTASFGQATLQPGEHPDQLLSRADMALYEAKEAGRDRIREAG